MKHHHRNTANAKFVYLTEDIATWTLLGDMYADRSVFAFPFQMQVLISQYETLRQIERLEDDTVVVIERSPTSAHNVFVSIMRDEGIFTHAEILAYDKFYDYVQSKFNRYPATIVYMKASPETCADRIHRRNRPGEQDISVNYLRSVHDRHESWLDISRSDKVSLPYIIVDASMDSDSVADSVITRICTNCT